MSLALTAPSLPVGRLVVRPAVRVAERATIAEAASLMRSANISSVLVGAGSAIVTERDLARAWASGLGPEEPAWSIASEHPLAVDAEASVAEAAAVMLNHEVRHLVVAMPDGGKGVVSLRAVMAVLVQAVTPEVWLTTLRVGLVEHPEHWWG